MTLLAVCAQKRRAILLYKTEILPKDILLPLLDPSIPGKHDAGSRPSRSRQRMKSVQELERSLAIIDAAEKEKLHSVVRAPIGHRAWWVRGVDHDLDALAAQGELSSVKLQPLRGQHHETVGATEDPGNPLLKRSRQIGEEAVEAEAEIKAEMARTGNAKK